MSLCATHGYHLKPLWFFLVFVLNLTAVCLIWYTAIQNLTSSTLTSDMGRRAWLIKINETNAFTGDIIPLHKPIPVDPHHPESAIPHRRDGSGDGLKAWGFGVFGWCGWDSSTETEKGNGVCSGRVYGWSIPGSAEKGDPTGVERLRLPSAIAKSLSISSGFIIASGLFALLILILHLLTAHHHGPSLPSVFCSSRKPPEPIKSPVNWPQRQFNIARHVRSASLFPSLLFAVFLFTIPTFACVGVGLAHYRGGKDGYIAEMGYGTYALLAAVVCMTISTLIVLAGGLWSAEKNPAALKARAIRNEKHVDTTDKTYEV